MYPSSLTQFRWQGHTSATLILAGAHVAHSNMAGAHAAHSNIAGAHLSPAVALLRSLAGDDGPCEMGVSGRSWLRLCACCCCCCCCCCVVVTAVLLLLLLLLVAAAVVSRGGWGGWAVWAGWVGWFGIVRVRVVGIMWMRRGCREGRAWGGCGEGRPWGRGGFGCPLP